jgi:hypothetical protein
MPLMTNIKYSHHQIGDMASGIYLGIDPGLLFGIRPQCLVGLGQLRLRNIATHGWIIAVEPWVPKIPGERSTSKDGNVAKICVGITLLPMVLGDAGVFVVTGRCWLQGWREKG